jgi:methylglyoxal synthase
MDRPIGIPSNPNDESTRKAVLALVAHDEKKDDLLRLAKRYRSSLDRLHLLATFHTGALLSEEVGLPVERFGSGPEGGDIQIGARIVQGDVDAVVFLRDPLTAHPHEPDIQALLKVCDVHGVPVATNLASAEILLRSLSQAIWWGRDAAAASHA